MREVVEAGGTLLQERAVLVAAVMLLLVQTQGLLELLTQVAVAVAAVEQQVAQAALES
jgi:hypothetical protein